MRVTNPLQCTVQAHMRVGTHTMLVLKGIHLEELTNQILTHAVQMMIEHLEMATLCRIKVAESTIIGPALRVHEFLQL